MYSVIKAHTWWGGTKYGLEDFCGNTEDTPITIASSRTDLNDNQNKDDETWKNETTEEGTFPALKLYFERQLDTYHSINPFLRFHRKKISNAMAIRWSQKKLLSKPGGIVLGGRWSFLQKCATHPVLTAYYRRREELKKNLWNQMLMNFYFTPQI